jgi:hypothetical protein
MLLPTLDHTMPTGDAGPTGSPANSEGARAMRFYVYRYGSNAANQPMEPGPVKVATVEADTADEACRLAARRVTCYANQQLAARPADEVDADEAEVDRRVILD